MEQTEDQGCGLGVGLKPEPFLIEAKIIECLVDDRQANGSYARKWVTV